LILALSIAMPKQFSHGTWLDVMACSTLEKMVSAVPAALPVVKHMSSKSVETRCLLT